MDEVRSEIRAAFEKEQAGLAPAAALRRNLVEAVAARPRPGRSFQWAAVAAAVLLAVLVVAGLLSTRLLARHANVTSPHVTQSPLGDYGPPPAGVPLIYVHHPSHVGWLIGFDWSGNPRATVKLDQAAMDLGAIRMAPDGQSFVGGPNESGETGEFRDRFGQPIPGGHFTFPGNITAYGIWADDNVHLCGISFDTHALTYSLSTVAPGEAVKSVVVTTPNQIGDQEALGLLSCSFRNDRAIIQRRNKFGPTEVSVVEVWVVKVSDGELVSRNSYSAGSDEQVIGSADATLTAEYSRSFPGQVGTAARTTIRKVSDRSVIATLDPLVQVFAFSSDNSLVLTYTEPGVGGTEGHLAVIELQSGRTIWSYTGPDQSIGGDLVEPGGDGFAVIINSVDPAANVVIVHGDGTTTQLPGRYVPTW